MFISRRKKTKILLSYSERHFSPKQRSEKELMSAGQIAANIYDALAGYDVVYKDEPRRLRNADLIFSPFIHKTPEIKARRRVSFPTISHPFVTNQIVINEARAAGEFYPDYVWGSRELQEYKRSFDASDLIVLIGNEHVRQTYVEAGIDPEKLVLVNCGIDAERFCRTERQSSAPVFVHNVSRFCVSKGTHYLLDAWERVVKHCPEARLLLLGRNSKETAWKTGLGKRNVELIGSYQPGAETYIASLNRAHFVVHPSINDGQPGTVLEAMACGCVPILFRSSGLDAEKYGGLQAEIGSVASLTECMITAVDSWSGWQERSLAVRREIETSHAWCDFRKKIRNVVDRLVKQN